MALELRLLCVLAHPDDESMGTGGVLARYAAEGVETYVLTATRGERGWLGSEQDDPGPEGLGRIREGELRCAAQTLGVCQVDLLDYVDGDLDRADPAQATAKIAAHLRRVRPQVVVTFDPFGAYGHPDHIAISQFAVAAALCAADPEYAPGDEAPAHRVDKLYYFVGTRAFFTAIQAAFGEQVMHVDGAERRPHAWEDWMITTRIDTAPYRQQVWQAVMCHRSQVPAYERLKDLPDDYHRALWDMQHLYRALSTVNGGRAVETDLFEGIGGR